MKYEYQIKMICKLCGSKHNFTNGVEIENKTKDKIMSGYKNRVCENCGGKLEMDKGYKYLVDKKTKNGKKITEIKDKELIYGPVGR